MPLGAAFQFSRGGGSDGVAASWRRGRRRGRGCRPWSPASHRGLATGSTRPRRGARGRCLPPRGDNGRHAGACRRAKPRPRSGPRSRESRGGSSRAPQSAWRARAGPRAAGAARRNGRGKAPKRRPRPVEPIGKVRACRALNMSHRSLRERSGSRTSVRPCCIKPPSAPRAEPPPRQGAAAACFAFRSARASARSGWSGPTRRLTQGRRGRRPLRTLPGGTTGSGLAVHTIVTPRRASIGESGAHFD